MDSLKKAVNLQTIMTSAVLAIVFSGLLYFVLQSQSSEKPSAGNHLEQALQNTAAEYTDLNGNPIDLDSFRGVRVVNSWASWCPFCVEELKDFEILADEFKDQDVTVIAINRKEEGERAKRFLEKLGTFDHTIFVLDPADAFYRSIQGFAMPETVFYRADGTVSHRKRGFMAIEEMRQHTQAALSTE